MIDIKDLVKRYKIRSSDTDKKKKEITAVNGINLSIEKGEIFGLIGPNGAGKTTTLKILSTLIIPDEGTVLINGNDVFKNPDIVRSQIGLLAGEFARSLYWRLSGYKNLRFFAKLREVKNPDQRIDELLELFKLTKYKNELLMKYSTGMKHKLALAVGLLHDPEVLFLDEPLTGIDPLTAMEIKQMIKNKFKHKTIIWASHNLYEIEEMCNRIALINNGNIVLEGEPETLKSNYWDHTKIIINTDKPKEFLKFGKNVSIKKNIVEIQTKNIKKTLSDLTYFFLNKDIEIIDLKTKKPTLEEIFIEGVKDVK